jgi:hypothetical protein
VGIPVDVNQVPQTYTAELNIACELWMHVLNQSVNQEVTYSVVSNKRMRGCTWSFSEYIYTQADWCLHRLAILQWCMQWCMFFKVA